MYEMDAMLEMMACHEIKIMVKFYAFVGQIKN